MPETLFLNKIAGPSPATLLKKRPWHRCFPMNFAKFLRTPVVTKHFWWLLLIVEPAYKILIKFQILKLFCIRR